MSREIVGDLRKLRCRCDICGFEALVTEFAVHVGEVERSIIDAPPETSFVIHTKCPRCEATGSFGGTVV